MKCIIALLILGVTFVTAANIQRTGLKLLSTDLDVNYDADETEVYWTFANPLGACGRKCFVKWWIVCGCLKEKKPETQAIETYENLPYEGKETDSCDELGCKMFCQKNHMKNGVCRPNGCECDFRAY